MSISSIPGLENSEPDYEVPKRRHRVRASRVLLGLALVVPNVLLLLVFTYRPLVDNIRLSFFSWNIASTRPATFIGLGNYIEWFTTPESWQILGQTAAFTVIAVLGSMVLGLALAMLLDQPLRGRNVVRSLVFAPYVISGAAVGVAFQFVFDPGYGLIQDLLGRIGLDSPQFYTDPFWAMVMITSTYVWKNLGYTFVIYLAALQGLRQDLREAAEIDRTSPWRTFVRVTLPQLRPTTFFLSITVLLNSFQVFDIIQVMTKGGPYGTSTTTLVYQVYQETFVNNRAGYGAAVATIMFLIVLVVTVIQVRAGERKQS
ncbi:carbohydrate ABC transporter permease [Curtobacterium sp. S6]|uniref:carbohydrate ABC transporter permease n=1 Tax=Curtobacterium sp. S6 TaxID=1479623 RepID=UPI0004AB6CF5|nr:sugar ABC transporter permease [Curtobacterium sp. S6]